MRFFGHLGVSAAFVFLVNLHLMRQAELVRFMTQNPDAAFLTKRFAVLGLALVAGVILGIPRVFGLVRTKGALGLDLSLLAGQGLPALLLWINILLLEITVRWQIPVPLFVWMTQFDVYLQLLGGVWLGLVLMRSIRRGNAANFVRQRRR